MRRFYILLGFIAIAAAIPLTVFAVHRLPLLWHPDAAATRVPNGCTPDGYFYKGRRNAAITVVEYSDFRCAACARYSMGSGRQIDREYVETSKVRIVFHEYPILRDTTAMLAAEACRCAGDQGAFWPMHDLLFARQTHWVWSVDPVRAFTGYAERLGLNSRLFKRTLSAHRHQGEVRIAARVAAALHLPGTPFFFIDGKRFTSETLRPAIEQALASRQGNPR